MPRMLLAFTACAALALCGGVPHRLFRTYLADPDLLGIGPGRRQSGPPSDHPPAGYRERAPAVSSLGVITAVGIRRLASRADLGTVPIFTCLQPGM